MSPLDQAHTDQPILVEARVRSGPLGYWDRFVGPDPSRVEQGGTWVLLAAAALWRTPGPQTPTSNVALRFITADLWAGAWVNNTPASVRWYERAGQGSRQHLQFALLHALHPALIAATDSSVGSRSRSSALRWSATHFAWMLVSSVVILFSPQRTRLPAAIVCTLAGTPLDRALKSSTAAPWFAPVYYTKLLVGHGAGSIWRKDT